MKGKRVLIIQQRNWAKTIGHFLAQKLQEEGCLLAALTLKKTTHEFILKQKEVRYELIISDDDVFSNPKGFLGDDDFTLEEICEALSVNSVWPMVSTIRNYVKSYREKFYYAFRQNVPDEEIVAYVKAVYKYSNIFFREFKPDLILAPNFVVLPHIMLYYLAKKRAIPMFAVTDSKVSGMNIFTHSFLDDEGSFFNRVDDLNNGKAQSQNRDRAKRHIEDFRKNFQKPDHAAEISAKESFVKKIRHEVSPYYHSIRFLLKRPINYYPNVGPTTDFRPPSILLRDHYAKKRYVKYMNRFSYYDLGAIGKYAYYPLQFQPEAAIDVVSPFYSNQIETARLVAMSLPGDYTLVVKEHPSMLGLRPPSYIEKVARTPNVKLIDYRIPNERVIRGADLLIGPGSTAMAEAAYYHKPAIQLGDLGVTLKLPNVFRHTDMTTLSEKIQEVLDVHLKNQEYERRLENFVAAVYDTGFDFAYFKVWSKGGGDMEELWSIYRKEIERVLR